MPIYVGVDVGTTKIATLFLDTESRAIKAVHITANDSEITHVQTRSRGWSECDAEQATRLTFKAMAETVRELRNSEEISGIGVTGQMHGMVLVSPDHRPLSPFISWQDQRCNGNMPGTTISYIDRMVELAGERGFSREGCHPATGYMGSTLFWLKENHALPPEPAAACFLPDYVVMRMTDNDPVSDPTNAGSSGTYDVVSREWDTELIGRLGLNTDLLPKVRNSGEVLGELTAEASRKTGLPQGTPICVACGDNQASFMGSVAGRQKTVLVNIGTGGQVSLRVPEYLRAEDQSVDTRCDLDKGYLLVGAILSGGSSYALLRRFFLEVGRSFFGAKGNEELYEEMTRLAATVPAGSDGLRCEPHFAGMRLDPHLGAVWTGMNESNFSPGHMTRALLEGVARHLHILYQRMLQSGVPPRTSLVSSGNGVRNNPLLAGILCDTFGIPLRVPVNAEEAALGAALLAAVGCGEFRDIEEAAQLVTYQ